MNKFTPNTFLGNRPLPKPVDYHRKVFYHRKHTRLSQKRVNNGSKSFIEKVLEGRWRVEKERGMKGCVIFRSSELERNRGERDS